jgi:hypothetical protein
LREGARLAGVRLDVAVPLRGRVVVDVRLAMGRTLPPRTTRHSRHTGGDTPRVRAHHPPGPAAVLPSIMQGVPVRDGTLSVEPGQGTA